jgi:phosphoglucomutase
MSETIHPLAGQPAGEEALTDIPLLLDRYHSLRPDPSRPGQRISFGTSGHRGSSLLGTFNEDHILAVTQAVAEYRRTQGCDGPLFLGMDSHALSEPARRTALEVLAAHGVEVRLAGGDGPERFTPTPVISQAILAHNRRREGGTADGIVITPSHNPPADGGFKYNPPTGGPAEPEVTRWIQDRANTLLAGGLDQVRRIPYERAVRAATTRLHDFVTPYVEGLAGVLDMEAIRSSGIRIGADPMGGSNLAYWDPIAHRYGLDLTVVNRTVDPTFRFMRLDWDGKIRMDCSSPHAMAGLVAMRDRFDIAFGNDTDSDRHGIVTPGAGLLNPNHVLAVAIRHLFTTRRNWRADAGVGKTLVSSSLIDRVAADIGRRVVEVPVGFKWFVAGLLDGSLGFGGEESAGASFLALDGSPWSTDKDGIIMDLLAAEITAVTGRDPGDHYRELTARLGRPCYRRIDSPADPPRKSRISRLSAEDAALATLAGSPVTAVMTAAPGNGAPIGGLKVVAADGWFAARPSGTEDVVKLYAESFRDEAHLERILAEASDFLASLA